MSKCNIQKLAKLSGYKLCSTIQINVKFIEDRYFNKVCKLRFASCEIRQIILKNPIFKKAFELTATMIHWIL